MSLLCLMQISVETLAWANECLPVKNVTYSYGTVFFWNGEAGFLYRSLAKLRLKFPVRISCCLLKAEPQKPALFRAKREKMLRPSPWKHDWIKRKMAFEYRSWVQVRRALNEFKFTFWVIFRNFTKTKHQELLSFLSEVDIRRGALKIWWNISLDRTNWV